MTANTDPIALRCTICGAPMRLAHTPPPDAIPVCIECAARMFHQSHTKEPSVNESR